MGTVTRSTWTDDSGGGVDGSIINNAELAKVYDNVDTEVKSASHPTATTKSIIDDVMAGVPVHHFGGDRYAHAEDTTYPSGATADTLAPGTDIWPLDSALLAAGTYRLQAMLRSEDGTATATLALVNLSDASETALVTLTSTSSAGERKQSGAITFATAGTSKNYGVKLTTSDADAGAAAWDIQLIRTA